MAYPIPNNAEDYWKTVIFSKLEELAPVEIPLNEMRAPWPALPGFELKVIASEDYKYLGVTAKLAKDAVAPQERTCELMPDGLNLSFKIKSGEPKERARVFFKVEVVR